MLDSLNAKERSYNNSTNGINFTIRKVNLMFFFIVVIRIFFFNKYMITNPAFFVYNAMLSIFYTGDPKSWNGGMVEWRNGGMAEWRNGGMAEWWNGGMAEWRNGGMVEWWNGGK